MRFSAWVVSGLLVGVMACHQEGVTASGAESDLLPNSSEIAAMNQENAAYRKIVEAFAALKLDLSVDTSAYVADWPLQDATPRVLQRHGTPIYYYGYTYFHIGMSAVRSSASVSTDIVAPHGGTLLAFDWFGNPATSATSPAATIVAIYDTTSHAITTLTRLSASAALLTGTPVTVTKGDVIGKLFAAGTAPEDKLGANTKVTILDGDSKRFLNPASLFATYTDATPPNLQSLELYDDAGIAADEFGTYDVDFVVTASDVDTGSARNFEISAVSYSVTDEAGAVIATLPKCSLDDIYADFSQSGPSRVRELVDFGTSVQLGLDANSSDAADPARVFRYGITNLAVENGRCMLRDDAAAAFATPKGTAKVTITVTAWDARGNEKTLAKDYSVPQTVFPDPDPADGGAGDDGGVGPDGEGSAWGGMNPNLRK